MALSYNAALAALGVAAEEVKHPRPQDAPSSCEEVDLTNAVGRVAACNYLSPISTPKFDTSAMDGYAIRSAATCRASPDAPVLFEVRGTIAAGDDPAPVMSGLGTLGKSEAGACVEIMTGARFPPATPSGDMLDACVRLEDAVMMGTGTGAQAGPHPSSPRQTFIAITKPVPTNANRRFAGQDLQTGQLIFNKGHIVQPSHLMPLASAGIRSLLVRRRPRVAIWSTGCEIASGNSRVNDVNGPYLTAACSQLGTEAVFMGVLDDNTRLIGESIANASKARPVDIIITSGGVSAGKFDYVRSALDQIGASVVFHGLAIRPGHPVLFALLDSPWGKVAFFGLPGNPGAAAACFRFLVAPYVHGVRGQSAESPVYARLETLARDGPGYETPRWKQDPCGIDIFRPGCMTLSGVGNAVHEVGSQQGSAKLSPFVSANCWIHFRKGDTYEDGHAVDCYPVA